MANRERADGCDPNLRPTADEQRTVRSAQDHDPRIRVEPAEWDSTLLRTQTKTTLRGFRDAKDMMHVSAFRCVQINDAGEAGRGVVVVVVVVFFFLSLLRSGDGFKRNCHLAAVVGYFEEAKDSNLVGVVHLLFLRTRPSGTRSDFSETFVFPRLELR